MNTRWTCVAAILSIAWVTVHGAEPAPSPRVRQSRVVVLEMQPVAIDGDDATKLRAIRMECRETEPDVARLAWPWPGWNGSGDLRLISTVEAGSNDTPHRLTVEAEWQSTDGRPQHARRTLQVRDGGAAFVELWSSGRRRLTIAVQAALELRAEPIGAPSVGAAVAFQVRISAVLPSGTVDLETNDMTTFLGQPVAYSFRRGSGREFETLRLSLVPVGIHADALEFELELTGTVRDPNGDAVSVAIRRNVFATEGAVTEVQAPEGLPQSGYRFAIVTAF